MGPRPGDTDVKAVTDVGDGESPDLGGEDEPCVSGVKPLVEGESGSMEWLDHALTVELPVELPFLVGTSRGLSRSLPFAALTSDRKSVV